MVLILFFLLLVLQPPQVLGAGRVQIEANQKTGLVGAPLPVKVKLLQGDAPDSQPSTDEKAEIKIKNPASGQECMTDAAPSDSQGYVNGSCTAAEPGSMTIYATSKDRGDSSEEITLTFAEKDDQMREDAKKQPAQSSQPQSGQQGGSNLANQPGLAEDKNDDGGPLMEGLHNNSDEPAAAGAATETPPAAPPTSDIDLLNSLIYLTGGIILLIAGIYFIYVQSKQANDRKKSQTPQVADPPNQPSEQLDK